MKWLDITDREDFKPADAKASRQPQGILLTTHTPPAENMAYVIRKNESPGGAAPVTIAKVVRSVGRAGSRYYYAADLRFLNYDGLECVWPARETKAWPRFTAELTNNHTATRLAIVAEVPDLAAGVNGCREHLLEWVKPGTDQATITWLVGVAKEWAEIHGIELAEIDQHPRRSEGFIAAPTQVETSQEEQN
jgi:hypothetical protein